ncbi:MAG TPA: hypothetical protein VM223_11865, partial [Planctomycetota bacterium]|nr:hypothetical protein [Planctomycetota bacterium]
MNVIYLEAKDAKGARVKGALINIAEGQGTVVDAARVFRQEGFTRQALEGEGISLRKDMARQALALANLNGFLFNEVSAGRMSPKMGEVIGKELPD